MNLLAFDAVRSSLFSSRKEKEAMVRASRSADRPFSDIKSVFERQATSNPESYEEEKAPVFLLSAGWRSGSTLLQRLVVSDGAIFIWGEPYDHCGLVQVLARSLTCITESWPPKQYFVGDKQKSKNLAHDWIANLYPDLISLKKAHCQFFRALYENTSASYGYTRWGLKETRYGKREVDYLRFLFPGARFVLLTRDPRKAWESYRGRLWFSEWPHSPIHSVATFSRHWARLARDFISLQDDKDILLIRYEDLITSEQTIQDIEKHIGVTINRTILGEKIEGPKKGTRKCRAVGRLEQLLVQHFARSCMKQLCYLRG